MPHVELPQAEFKVALLGDSNAGKTSLVLRFAEGYYRDAPRSSTVGAFFITKRIQTSNGITCKVQIWDTAGQSQFRPMAPMYYRTAAAAIVCYDVTCAQSFKVMREWLDELHRNVPAGSIVIAIASTKCDLTKTMEPAVPFSEAEKLAQALGAIYVDTSAKENFGVTELFQRVAERVLRFRENGSELPVKPGATINENGGVMNGEKRREQMLADDKKETRHYPPTSRAATNDRRSKSRGRRDDDDSSHRRSNGREPSAGSSRKEEKSLIAKSSDHSENASNSHPGIRMCDAAPVVCGFLPISPTSCAKESEKWQAAVNGCTLS